MRDQRIATFRGLLTDLVSASRKSNDIMEVVHDRVAGAIRAIHRGPGMLDALEAAVGKNKSRRKMAMYIVTELSDVPEVVERIGEWLKQPDAEWRYALLQIIDNERLVQFAPVLSEVIEHDPDLWCRQAAIHAAASLRDSVNLPSLLRLSRSVGSDDRFRWCLVWAFKEYATPECLPYLREVFLDVGRSRRSDRVVAAWGLAKAKDVDAYEYLRMMLDDPDVETEFASTPGESLRAAQALCDLNGWPFEGHKSDVARTKRLSVGG